jgi:hypothetical protein
VYFHFVRGDTRNVSSRISGSGCVDPRIVVAEVSGQLDTPGETASCISSILQVWTLWRREYLDSPGTGTPTAQPTAHRYCQSSTIVVTEALAACGQTFPPRHRMSMFSVEGRIWLLAIVSASERLSFVKVEIIRELVRENRMKIRSTVLSQYYLCDPDLHAHAHLS